MSEKWKWSFRQALFVIFMTYIEDWGRADRSRKDFLSHPDISDIKDEHITGLQSGQGRTVIFIHGSPANAMRWQHYLMNPMAGYHMIAIDRMGFGNRGGKAPVLEEDFKHLKTFIQKFDSPIIVSHSLGGAHATRLASEGVISGLVLVASSINPLLERVMPIQRIAYSKWVRWILSRSIRHSNMEMIQLTQFMVSTEKKMKKIETLTHLIHAKDDFLVPFAQVDYAREHFTNLKITEIENGGHFIPWLKPDLVINAIKSIS